jgi:hypothetical protein
LNRLALSAVAAISLMGSGCGQRLPPECASSDRQQAKQLLSEAQTAFDGGQFSRAVTAARTGIGSIAANYSSKQYSDNSDVLLGVAGDAERRGRQDEAARALIIALQAQLGTYEAKCTPPPKRR